MINWSNTVGDISQKVFSDQVWQKAMCNPEFRRRFKREHPNEYLKMISL